MGRPRRYADNATRQKAYRRRLRNADMALSVTLPLPVYDDGSVVLYCGDAQELLPLVADLADIAITDPPYNLGMNYRSCGDNRADYEAWCRAWFALCPRPLVFTPGKVNLSMWGRIADPTWTCAWNIPNQCSHTALRGLGAWEPVLVYGRPSVLVPRDAWERSISTSQRDTGGHPCPKDLRAWRELVARFTAPGELVLDPFAGVGTTLRAAKDLGRRAIGIELDEQYCQIAARRLAQGVFAPLCAPAAELT